VGSECVGAILTRAIGGLQRFLTNDNCGGTNASTRRTEGAAAAQGAPFLDSAPNIACNRPPPAGECFHAAVHRH
jgi:hypothetical protein